jgi:hypothetical protein
VGNFLTGWLLASQEGQFRGITWYHSCIWVSDLTNHRGFQNPIHRDDRNPYTGDQFHHKPCTFTGKWEQAFMPKEIHELRIPMYEWFKTVIFLYIHLFYKCSTIIIISFQNCLCKILWIKYRCTSIELGYPLYLTQAPLPIFV